jgi:hypothetical protein
MMSEAAPDFETLLREALPPVEPRDDFVKRLESALTNLTEIAAEELESWELSAMRDPRNWGRPAAALLVGGAAGTALVLLRARQREQASGELSSGRANLRELAERTLEELGEEARKLVARRSG